MSDISDLGVLDELAQGKSDKLLNYLRKGTASPRVQRLLMELIDANLGLRLKLIAPMGGFKPLLPESYSTVVRVMRVMEDFPSLSKTKAFEKVAEERDVSSESVRKVCNPFMK